MTQPLIWLPDHTPKPDPPACSHKLPNGEGAWQYIAFKGSGTAPRCCVLCGEKCETYACGCPRQDTEQGIHYNECTPETPWPMWRFAFRPGVNAFGVRV